MNIFFILATIIYRLEEILYGPYSYIYILITIFTCIPLIFINLYNGKKGKDIKWLLYLFYPIHLLIFYVLNVLL